MASKLISKYLFALISTLIFLSCKNNLGKTYYDTGELKEEIREIDGKCVEIKTFTRFGKLLSTGRLCDSLREGRWEEYYSDGVIKWRGEYHLGKRQYNDTIVGRSDCNLSIKENPEYLKVGKKYHLRPGISNIHPNDLAVMINNGKIRPFSDTNEYDFEMTPERQGSLKLQILIGTLEGVDTLCVILFEVK